MIRTIRKYLTRGASTAQAAPPQKIEVRPKMATAIDLLHEDAVRESYLEFRDHMQQAMLFPQKGRMRTYCVDLAIANLKKQGLFLEFGVFRAEGLNLFAKRLRRHGLSITGFDSLEGLEEDWLGNHNGREAGAYSVHGKAPQLEANADLRAGWVQDTLPPFLREHPDEKIAFAHLDFDTYTPTAFTLDLIRPRLVKGSVILFDELYGYPGWRIHEYKALKETFPDAMYKYISFSKEAVGIQILEDQ